MGSYTAWRALTGLLGPFVVGALKHSRGDYTDACLFLAVVIAFGAAVAYVVLPIVSDDTTLQPFKVELELATVREGDAGSRV